MKVRRRREDVEIPTASMADIAFLLIVFFMVTTVFAETKGLTFSVPEEPEETLEQPAESEEAVHVKIGAGGGLTVDGAPVDRARVEEDLKAYLLPKLERWPEKPIILTADEDASYGLFVEAYDGLRVVETVIHEKGILPRHQGLKISVLSLSEVKALKARFGEDIFE